ncbi:MAG: hypothetical protein EXR76_09510 [Myxococcales bacterium]|nr:hypothetical protein [Myxococcales bacterium]
MPMDTLLLDFVVCPETREKLSVGNAELLAQLNAAFDAGTLKNRTGQPVRARLEALLVRADQKFGYPVWDDIPNLLIDEGIPLETT